MTRREEQAFNDGKLAYAEGKGFESCSRRSAQQRAAWLEGYEEERRRRISTTATPEQLEEGRRVLGKLKDFAQSL